MVIAFWNIDNKEGTEEAVDFSDILMDFIDTEGIDMLILGETNDITVMRFLAKTILKNPDRPFNHIRSAKGRTTLLSSLSSDLFKDESDLYTSSRWDAFHIQVPGIINFNLITVHFNSKVNWSESSLALECANFARDISLIEERTGCVETILIGDFNMNPFEDGMVAANGLNAIQDLDYTFNTTKGREVDGKYYKYFYNPMWNFFGDFRKPLGTHYYRASGHVSQEWNLFDQVIFRPSLRPHLDKDYVKIIDRIAGYDLTKFAGRPNEKKYSDHLPIVFKLKI